VRVDPTKLPSTLAGQLSRQLPAYIAGAVVLAIFQTSMNRIDWLSKSAVDILFGPHAEDAWRPALFMFGLAVIAFVTRVASRWYMFNAGRDVECEVRTVLLARLSTARCPPASS
jgi:ATP-binding cassette subfamily B multidrug efflux pump